MILPTVGHAVLGDAPGDHDVATLETDGCGAARVTLGPHAVELPAAPHLPASGWHPARLLSWTPSEPDPSVLLDDADPYRDFRSPWLPPAPLTDGESDTWQRHLHDAARLLGARHPDAARTVPLVLNSLVPLPGMPRFRTASASYAEAFGSALVSLPRDAVDFAVTLVHESRHSVLNGLSHQIQLVDRAARGPLQDTLFYAPWRTDPRPPWGLLHGTYAFTGVADFWRAERHALTGPRAVLAHFEFAVWREAVAIALHTLVAQPGLTPGAADSSTGWRARPPRGPMTRYRPRPSPWRKPNSPICGVRGAATISSPPRPPPACSPTAGSAAVPEKRRLPRRPGCARTRRRVCPNSVVN